MKDVLPFIRQHIKYPTSATTTTFTGREQDLVSLLHSIVRLSDGCWAYG